MPVPTPPSSLDGSCSVIYENTLYSYTSEAFLSLRLEEGAKWKKLPMGEGVTGAVCVGTTSADPAFVVVGGTGGSDGYSGLQQYSFSTGNWSTITPSVLVTQDRQWHGATYIKADDVILVYAGSQDGVKAPSQQTFTIQASAPYAVKAYSANAPATVEPILLNWSDADACMIGGDTTNTVVSLFNPTALWRDSGATLAQPLLKDRSSIQAVMMLGDDGSKSIYTFDLTESPNVVDRIVLQDASGAPVANSPAITDKRDLTLSDWPSYNSTLAPTETRSNYAVAQADGMVIFSGGNDADPIAMFDADGNSWMNATAFLSEDQQKILSDTTSTESASSATATSTTSHKKHKSSTISTATDATSTSFTTTAIAENSASATAAETTTAAAVAAAATGNSTDLSSNAILGITLGSILAFMTVLGIILFLIRRRKARRQHLEAGHARRDSGPAMDEKDPVAFANGTHHEPPSPGYFRGHHPQLSNESYSSMAILMGRVGQQKSSLTRKPSNDSQSSSASTLHKQQLKSTISKPIPQPRPQIMQHPALQGQDDKGVAFDPTVVEPRRRNGPLEAQDGMRRSSGWNRYWSGGSALQILGFGGSKRTTMGSDQSSHYSESTHQNPRVTQDSATVPPLNFEGRPEVNRVNSGSPVVASYGSKIPFKDGMAGKIVDRPSSKASSGYSSGIPESVNDAWDPNDAAKPWGTDRAPSSAYNPSFYYATPLSPSRSGTRHPPSGVSKQPQLAMASTSSDMSWLNLGDQSRV